MGTRLLPVIMARPLAFHSNLKRPCIGLQCHQLNTLLRQQMGSQVNQKINFPAMEAKWRSKWQNRKINMQDRSPVGSVHQALAPIYRPHLRQSLSILQIIEYHHAKIHSSHGGATIFDKIFQIDLTENSELHQFIQSHGTDVVRTSLLFYHKTICDVGVDEYDLEITKKWFELIKKAVLVAHDSFLGTQECSDAPNVPEALYEANLETWNEYIDCEHLHIVQIPPGEPETPNESTDADEHRLWLIAQKLILIYTMPISSRNSTQRIITRLVQLSRAIITYDDCAIISCSMHYYSARVLVSLLAPFAPSFAEECWVHLHYGHLIDDTDFEDDITYDGIEEEIRELERDLNGGLPLARQGKPSTLSSIFDQPFPVAKITRLGTRRNHAGVPLRPGNQDIKED